MGDIFGNIFDDEEEKKSDGVNVQSSQTTTQSPTTPQNGGMFGDIFADSGTAEEIRQESQPIQEEEDGFLDKTGDVLKGVGAKAVDAGKSVIKFGLDLFNKQVQKNNQVMLEHANWQNRTMGFGGGKQYETFEEYEQDIPLVKFLNSDTGRKVVGGISEVTSNIPIKKAAEIKAKYEVAKYVITGQISLKEFANIREIADREYDQAYSAFITERNDPDNPAWQRFLYELQDTGVQSGVGILLSMGTAALTRNAQASVAVSSAYYTALSADEQIQSKGKVDSLGNIAIDVVGDQMINKVLGGVLSGGSKSSFKAALEGFGVEGSTEVLQSLTKYANDYANATTEEQKNAILAEAKQYVVSGAIAMEFAVGGVVGGAAGAITGGGANPSSQPNDATTKSQKKTVPRTVPELTLENTDVDDALAQLTKLETTGNMDDPKTVAQLGELRDVINDYTRAFNDKTVYVPSEVSQAPLIDITTTTLPSGKVAVKFSANTETNGIASTYDFNQLFSTKEKATKSAQDAIVAWAQTQESDSPQERAELDKMIDFAQNPRPLTNEAADLERTTEEAQIQERGEIDGTALEQDLAKVSEAAPELTRIAKAVKVGEVIQYVPATATGATTRQTGQVLRVNEKSITLRDPSGRTKRIPITARVTENITESISEKGREVFDTEKAPRKKPEPKKKPVAKKKKAPVVKKTATAQAVTDAINTSAPLNEQADGDVNAQFMALASEKPLEAIKSPEYKEMIARGFELKNNNDPFQGFAFGSIEVVDGKLAEQAVSRIKEKVQADELIRDVVITKKNIKDPEGNLAPAGMDPLNRIMYVNAGELGNDLDALLREEVIIDGKQIKRNGRTDKQMVNDYVDMIVKFEKSHIENLTIEDAQKISQGLLTEVNDDLDRRAVEKRKKQYPTIHDGGKVKMVEGTPVKIVEGIETFLHEGDGGWIVSEASSGRFIAESLSKEGVIAKAGVAINEVGKEKFVDLVKKNALTIPQAKQYAPSGYASAVFDTADLTAGGQPETAVAELPIVLGHLDSIRPVELPELVDIARELMGGQVPQVTKLRDGKGGGTKLGDFMPAGGGRIRLQRFLFEQENLPQAAKTLAHEMGHLIDYLPEGNIARGNLLGRLASLRGFMQSTFSFESGTGLPKTERARLQTEARRAIAEQTGKPQKDFTDADKKAVKDLYKKNLAAAIKSGGYIENATIKKELLTLTRWWKPYDPAVSEAYNKYRESAAELYADAISVLFNAPQRLRDIAPTFYEKFFEGLDTKPDVRDAYFEVQALLSGDRDAVVKRRREGVKRMFKEGDYKAIDLHNRRVQERENRRKQYWAKFKHEMVSKNYQIIDRVKKAQREGKIINPDENPIYFLEERNYLGGKIKALFEREFNTIYSTLNENDITWEDFGELLFYERITAGDRSDVANPRGITPEAAKELIANVKEQYGDARWEVMTEQTEKFRAANKKVAEEAYEASLYKKELYDQMQENPAYVSFQVLDHIEDGMTSRVYKSLGTLKDITNPADATMLKIITTIRASERNRATLSVVDFLTKNFSEQIEEADYIGSKKGRLPMKSKDPNKELITLFRNGVIKGYYVDPYIAQTIKNDSVGQTWQAVEALKFINSSLFRPLFINFNLGFQLFNFKKDFVRFYKNVPNLTFTRAMKRYKQAYPVARVRAFGLPKNATKKQIEAAKLLNKLEEEQVLSVTYNDLIRGETNLDKQVEKILADTGVKEFQPKPTIEKVPRFAKPAVKALDKLGVLKVTSEMLGFIENLGNLIETLPKAAGVFELQDSDGNLTTEQKSFIRRKIGSPDFLDGGIYKPITNELFLFSNAITQGIRSDFEVATEPQTRSGWWWKTVKVGFLPKLLMMAVLYGALGDEYKEMMEDASEYDRTNYTVIPLGKDSTGKTIYFRLPADETTRLLSGIFWKMLRANKNETTLGADIMNIVSYTGGQIPSFSPAFESVGATYQFMSGQNPYDKFRGRQVLSDTVFKAGGTEATKAFLGWQFQQLGGGIFYRFYHEPSAKREQGNVEKFFNAPVIGNVLGRFVRVSNYGQLEKLKAIEAGVEKEKAPETLSERKLLNKYVDQAREQNIRFSTSDIENKLVKESLGGRMPATKDELSESKQLVKKFRLSLRRGNADPNVTALIDASSNDVKLEILKQLQSDMSDSEFSALRRDLISSKIVSDDVFNELIKSK